MGCRKFFRASGKILKHERHSHDKDGLCHRKGTAENSRTTLAFRIILKKTAVLLNHCYFRHRHVSEVTRGPFQQEKHCSWSPLRLSEDHVLNGKYETSACLSNTMVAVAICGFLGRGQEKYIFLFLFAKNNQPRISQKSNATSCATPFQIYGVVTKSRTS